MAEEETTERSGHWWRRLTLGIAITILLVLWTVFEWAHYVDEHYEPAIDAILAALRHVDLVSAIDGFVVGMTAVPFGSAGYWTPIAQFFAGLHGLWTTMLAGGWTAVLAGVTTVLAGIGLLFFAGAALGKANDWPDWLIAPASAIALVFAAIVVFTAGLSFVAFAEPLYSNVPQASVLTQGFDDLSGGFAESRAAYQGRTAFDPASQEGEGAYVAPFARRFAMTHVPFILVTAVIGIVVVVLLSMVAQAMEAGILLVLLIPSFAIAVIVTGAGVAYIGDHLLLVGLILLLIKLGTVSLPAVLGVGIVTLDKGKLFGELLAGIRELAGRVR
jgi:hypothetical protein